MYGGDRSIDMDCCDDGRSSSTQESTELFTESDAETSRLKGARDIPPSGSENEKKKNFYTTISQLQHKLKTFGFIRQQDTTKSKIKALT